MADTADAARESARLPDDAEERGEDLMDFARDYNAFASFTLHETIADSGFDVTLGERGNLVIRLPDRTKVRRGKAA